MVKIIILSHRITSCRLCQTIFGEGGILAPPLDMCQLSKTWEGPFDGGRVEEIKANQPGGVGRAEFRKIIWLPCVASVFKILRQGTHSPGWLCKGGISHSVRGCLYISI